MFDKNQKTQIEKIFKEQMDKSFFRLPKDPPHKHDGVDNIRIPASSVIPSTGVMGKIKFTRNATYTLNFSANQPTTLSFNGVALNTASDISVTFNSGFLAGDKLGTLVSAFGGSSATYLLTFSSGEVRAAVFTSGSLTVTWTTTPLTKRASSTAFYSTASSSALVVGSATLFKTFYFQPLTNSAVSMGGTPFPINGVLAQCSTNLYLDSTNIANIFPHVDQFFLVNVFSPAGHIITGQLINLTSTSVDFQVTNLASGWELIGNFIIT